MTKPPPCEQIAEIGDELGPIRIPLTLQRLVIEAGANRDFSLIHHDGDAAQGTGAADAYANTYFLLGMFERLLREWAGLRAQIRSIRKLRMKSFNCVGDLMSFQGRVSAVDRKSGTVEVVLSAGTESGETVTAQAVIQWPVA